MKPTQFLGMAAIFCAGALAVPRPQHGSQVGHSRRAHIAHQFLKRQDDDTGSEPAADPAAEPAAEPEAKSVAAPDAAPEANAAPVAVVTTWTTDTVATTTFVAADAAKATEQAASPGTEEIQASAADSTQAADGAPAPVLTPDSTTAAAADDAANTNTPIVQHGVAKADERPDPAFSFSPESATPTPAAQQVDTPAAAPEPVSSVDTAGETSATPATPAAPAASDPAQPQAQVQAQASPAAPADPQSSALASSGTHTGWATYYPMGGGYTACGNQMTDQQLAVAINGDYFRSFMIDGNPNHATICGALMTIKGPLGTQTAPVVDSCGAPGTCASSKENIDLTPALWDLLAGPDKSPGHFNVTWSIS